MAPPFVAARPGEDHAESLLMSNSRAEIRAPVGGIRQVEIELGAVGKPGWIGLRQHFVRLEIPEIDNLPKPTSFIGWQPRKHERDGLEAIRGGGAFAEKVLAHADNT